MSFTVSVSRTACSAATAFLLATLAINGSVFAQNQSQNSSQGKSFDPFSPSSQSVAVSNSSTNSSNFDQPSQPPAAASDSNVKKFRWRNEDIRKALEAKTDLIYDDTPWSDVAAELEERFQFNVVLHHTARDDSLTEDEPLTVDLRGIPLKAALRIALVEKNATFLVRNNVLLIISLDDAEDTRYFESSFINVRSLLAKIKTLERDRIGKPKHSRRMVHGALVPVVGAGNGGGKGGGLFRVGEQAADDSSQQTKSVSEKSDQPELMSPDDLISAESLLLELVQSTVDNESWYETGQGLGTIDIVGGVVVMNTTAETTDEVREFLNELEVNMTED
jgi:hypothetical protein